MNYTSVEQSKKLLELGISPETADLKFKYDHNEHRCIEIPMMVIVPNWDDEYNKDIPCWSLAALLGVLPDYTLQTNTDGTVFVVCESKKPMISDAYDNPVDACFEMVICLHELKML